MYRALCSWILTNFLVFTLSGFLSFTPIWLFCHVDNFEGSRRPLEAAGNEEKCVLEIDPEGFAILTIL